jgi:hypothetical protein
VRGTNAVTRFLLTLLCVLLVACSPGVKQVTTIRIAANSQQVTTTNSALNKELSCSIPKVFDRMLTFGSNYRSIVNQFRAACVQHDFCYRHGATTYGLTQAQCDDDLYDQITLLCDDELNVPSFRWLCKIRRQAVDIGVTLGGARSFQSDGFFHEYDAAPRNGHSFDVVRVAQSKDGIDELYLLKPGSEAAKIRRFRYQQDRFASLGPLQASDSISAKLQIASAPIVVDQSWVWTHGLRAGVPAVDSPLISYAPPSVDAITSLSSGANPPKPAVAPWARDFDGDGTIDYVAVESGLRSDQSMVCDRNQEGNSDGSTFLSVYTGQLACRSRSILNKLDGLQAPVEINCASRFARKEAEFAHRCLNREKYRKLQFPPIVGNFLLENQGPQRLEILLYWLSPAKSEANTLHAWLLRNDSCTTASGTSPGLCWRAQRVAPLTVKPDLLSVLPLVSVPMSPRADSTPRADVIDALDFNLRVNSDCGNDRNVADRTLRFRIERNAADLSFAYVPLKAVPDFHFDLCAPHGPMYYVRGNGVMIQITGESSFDVINFKFRNGALLSEHSICRFPRGSRWTNLQIKRSPMMFGSFSASGRNEFALVDLISPSQSLVFTRLKTGEFRTIGKSQNEVVCTSGSDSHAHISAVPKPEPMALVRASASK